MKKLIALTVVAIMMFSVVAPAFASKESEIYTVTVWDYMHYGDKYANKANTAIAYPTAERHFIGFLRRTVAIAYSLIAMNWYRRAQMSIDRNTLIYEEKNK